MIVSERRQQWLRAKVARDQCWRERAELCSARLDTSRLGFVMRRCLYTEESIESAGKLYDALVREVDARITQLDGRIERLDRYIAERWP